MKLNDIRKHIDLLRQMKLSERVEDISRDVFSCISDTNYGKRCISKKEFITEFNNWIKQTFVHENDRKFDLSTIIPDDRFVDVKLINIPWVHPVDNIIKTHYYLWLVQIHRDIPILNKPDGTSKKVNALCTIGGNFEYIVDDECDTIPLYTNVGVIMYGDNDLYGSRFAHVIKHEIVHFVSHCLMIDLDNIDTSIDYTDRDNDEFKFKDIDEFIADITPYYITTELMTDRFSDTLNRFNRDLYSKINPSYSDLYTKIIRKLISSVITD